ncbi:MAG: DUF262 domain-containing protein, partial [Polyangiaceae bacterium]|nr:DUF262 domain-containing protein [Polyangiaceae bacterium]
MVKRLGPPSYLAEPTIQYLFQVLEQVASGELLFPRFQRFGVWRPDQRRELLRSVFAGIPIGTLMLWRTTLDSVQIERRIGVHVLPEPRKGERTRQYVLDGVQRLSTLYGALFPPNADDIADDGEQEADFRVYYDLKAKDFFVESELEEGAPMPFHLPLTAIRDSVELLRFQRRLQGEEADRWTERADAVARAFREYKVPVVPLASDDLAHVTKTFQRVNTQGTPMSEIHMVNALTYDEDFDLLDRIREVKQETLAPRGWGSLDDETVLRTIKALLGTDIYATKPDETRDALKEQPEIVGKAANALARTADFLSKHCGIHSPALVPYTAQILLLAKTFANAKRIARGRYETLTDWIALTTYTELFSKNMSDSRFNAFVEELQNALNGEPLVWSGRRPLTRQKLPPGFDFRHARARFLALRMARAGAQDPMDKNLDPFVTLATHGVLAMPPLVTSKMAGSSGPWLWLRSPGARFVVAEGSLQAFRERVCKSDADRAFLASHLISDAVHRLLVAGRYGEAVRKREAELNDAEQQDFEDLLRRYDRLQPAAS